VFNISPKAKHFCSNAILITGSARSGTTLVGSLIHSMEKVEYVYEPPLLVSLLTLIENLNESHWRLLYETYLYEEFFLNSIAGRAINCNRVDDSSIFKTKTTQEIELRLCAHVTKGISQQRSIGSVIAFKITDIVYTVPKLKEYYPSLRVLVVLRDAVDTINSLLQKKWFSRETPNSDLIWPFSMHEGVNVPYWVKVGDEVSWITMSELDRAAYYYIRVNENVADIFNRIEIKYSDLIHSPKKEVGRIAEILNLDFGDKTKEIIKRITRTVILRNQSILLGIRSDLRQKVIYYSSLCECVK
jgi:hypothetical protein